MFVLKTFQIYLPSFISERHLTLREAALLVSINSLFDLAGNGGNQYSTIVVCKVMHYVVDVVNECPAFNRFNRIWTNSIIITHNFEINSCVLKTSPLSKHKALFYSQVIDYFKHRSCCLGASV